MSRRHELEQHLQVLGEIRDIMSAMKNLSFMEVRKLTRFLSTQRRVVASMESAAADFLGFHPHLLARQENARNVYLLLGSERGFCGDFNEALLLALESHRQSHPEEQAAVIVMGYRLSATVMGKLADDPRVAAHLDGPAVVEEVQPVLKRLVDTLDASQNRRDSFHPLRLTVFHHHPDKSEVNVSVFQPFRQFEEKTAHFGHPPLLNLPPPAFLTELVNHYLFAALHELFYSSLMAENTRRLQHMDNAIHRIEKDSMELSLKKNRLRQEEITEEIEVIMLSAEAMKLR